MQKLHVKLLLNMTISNFAQYDFEFGLEKSTFVLTKVNFAEDFQNILDFTLSFFQALFKRWVNNQFKSYESSLLHNFYFQIDIVNKQLFSSVSWHNPLSKIKFHSLIPLRRTRLLLIFYETFIYKMSVR